jgi:hypothetical protein
MTLPQLGRCSLLWDWREEARFQSSSVCVDGQSLEAGATMRGRGFGDDGK